MSDSPLVTIVVPHRGNPLGLWATLHSCEEDLRCTDIDYNIVVVTNGEPVSGEVKQCLWFAKQSGKLLDHIHVDAPLTPPVARQLGSKSANGDVLFFFDNHCLVQRHYFQRTLNLLTSSLDVDLVHSAVQFYIGDPIKYHYLLNLEYDFWAKYSDVPDSSLRPYKVACCGHGAFAITKSCWDEVGGYGPDTLFEGYGGEEMIFDLKLWLYGKKVYLDPRLVHYHYTGNRGYTRHYTDDYYVNMMVAANVIGGEEWLAKLYESFLNRSHPRNGRGNMFDLMLKARERSVDYSKEVASRSLMTLDNLLKWFKSNQIAM